MTEDEARAKIAEAQAAFEEVSSRESIVTPEYKTKADAYYDAVAAYNAILPDYLRRGK
jgi:hypothetical protein